MVNHSDDTRLIQLPVSELKIGMFVAKLDKDWLDSRFLYQGFLIENIDHIDALVEECHNVWIDPQKAKLRLSASANKSVIYKTTTKKSSDQKQNNLISRKKTNTNIQHGLPGKKSIIPKKKVIYENSRSITEESQLSFDIFNQARSSTEEVFKRVGEGNTVDLNKSKSIVRSCMESILRNPSAMMWMSKIRNANKYTAEHSLNVCVLAIAFGRNLGFTKGQLYKIGLCGLLHDVGKMRLPTNVLDKAEKLTEKEWKQIKSHAYIGGKLLESSKTDIDVIRTAYQHHERIDGTGYPKGLASQEISLYSKMISLVDSFDAMTAKRCYSDPITPSAAIREVFKCRGKQFDTELALEFIKTIGLYPPGTIVELINGYIGLVVERNDNYRHLPKVLLLKDDKSNDIEKYTLDLTLTENNVISNEFLVKKDYPDGYKNIFLKNYHHSIKKIE